MAHKSPRLFASPTHPIFTHFTIALTASSLVFDGLGRICNVSSLAAAGWWTIVGAVPAAIGALASGLTSRRRLAMEEGAARTWLRAHMAIGPSFLGGLVASAIWRASLWLETAAIPWAYLVALGAVVAAMTVQGYLGGELVYRFGAEVRERYEKLPNEREPAGEPARRSRTRPA
jgi:uncharacterized membrane protein